MKVMKGNEYADYVRNSEELLTEHLQVAAELFGDEENDKLIIYRGEIRSEYYIIGEFDGEWAGDQWMFRAQLDQEGEFVRATGEVTAELIGFLGAAIKTFIDAHGDRTVFYHDENASNVGMDNNGEVIVSYELDPDEESGWCPPDEAGR